MAFRVALLVPVAMLCALSALADDAEALDRKIRQLEERIAQEERNAEEARRNIADLDRRVAERRAQVESLEAIRRRNVNDEQVEKLRRATKAQDDIASRIAILRKILEEDKPEPEKLVSENRAENALVERDVSAMEMVDAFELAKEIENAITESYKDIRATQTAIERRMGFEAAQKITDVARAVRLEADRAAIEDVPRTKEALDAQKAAQAEVVRETDSIVDTAVAMMQEAMDIVMPDDAQRDEASAAKPKAVAWLNPEDFEKRAHGEELRERLERMSAAADFQVAIADAAAEDESQRVKDLTKVMEDAAEVVKNTEAAGEARPDIAAVWGAQAAELAPLESKSPDLVGGNVIRFSQDGHGGTPAKWMYVRDWYSIGPFPNPDRVNIRRRFPPESVVDLDATYVGKDGRTVKWQFMQTRNSPPENSAMAEGRAAAVPPDAEEYGIWYAYAEVFCDVACERWIAVGSDDRSDIWVNDVPIWGSSNKLKSWRIDEGYRRIRLEKGRNRILARVENGWFGLCWSLCISLDDGKM